ncbi:MAG: hypothetical protein II266_00035, partial [Clostridia bacterium]|nr:hypothetical protein [Clostridia bacterium]
YRFRIFHVYPHHSRQYIKQREFHHTFLGLTTSEEHQTYLSARREMGGQFEGKPSVLSVTNDN